MKKKTNYEIIRDETELAKFIAWLPELEDHETYYMCLFARNKYCAPGAMIHIRSDKQQLKRFTTNKARMLDKIRQLECPLGAYTQAGAPIPQEALALYITPNPRSFAKATKTTLLKFAELATKPYQGWNTHQEAMSEIQKAKSRTVLVDFDFDGVEYVDMADEINAVVNPSAYSVVRTRGGFHLLVRPEMVDAQSRRSTWYTSLKGLRGCDVVGDGVMPVPGCTQGNFVPRLFV